MTHAPMGRDGWCEARTQGAFVSGGYGRNRGRGLAAISVFQRLVLILKGVPRFYAGRRIACMISRAIGAATSPPKPVWFSSTTATATFGSSAGAKQMNHDV
jgi:hypothetical protein